MVIKYSGPHHVGCLDLMLKSARISENFHPDVLCCSDLGSLLRLFYPSEPPTHSSKRATWLPEPNADQYFEAYVRELRFGYLAKKLLSFGKSFHLPIFVNEQLIKHQQLKPVFKSTDHTLPVVIFSHGLMGHRNCYTEFCAQLASEGYLVVSVEHRDGSAISSYIKECKDSGLIEIPYHESPTKDSPETTAQRYVQVEQRSKEVSKALDIVELLNKDPTLIENCLEIGNFSIGDFQGRIDLSKPFLIGHSFGGATIIDTLNKDNRFKCGVGLDVWFTALSDECLRNPGNQSVLFIFTEYFNWKSNLQKTYDYMNRKEKGTAEMITLKAADHHDQSDIPGIIPGFFHPFLRGFFKHRISYSDAIEEQRKVISDFFKKCYNKQVTKNMSEQEVVVENICKVNDVKCGPYPRFNEKRLFKIHDLTLDVKAHLVKIKVLKAHQETEWTEKSLIENRGCILLSDNDYICPYHRFNFDGSSVNLLDNEYKLSPHFLVGSNIEV